MLSLSLCVIAGVCLGAAMHFAFLRYRLGQRLDGIYALGFFSGFLSFLSTLAYQHAPDLAHFKLWFQIHAVVSRPLMITWAYFVLSESNYRSPWPARVWLGAEGLKALLLLLFLDTPYFMRLEGVAHHASAWGETLTVPIGSGTVLYPIQFILPLMGLVFGCAAALRLWGFGKRLRGAALLVAVLTTAGSILADNILDAMGLPETRLAELVIFFPLSLMAWETTERLVTKTREAELESQLLHAQKMRSVGELASGIAHDFNNLLASIRLASEFLMERSPDAVEEKDILRRAVAQASELTRKLLAVGRRAPERPAALSLHAQLDAALSVSSASLGRGIRVEKDYSAERDMLLGDAGALQGAFINLALNARDAMNGQGTLRISTSLADDQTLEIRFQDEGKGILPADLPRIFDPYFTTKGEGKGSGLGLLMVQAAARAHGGEVEAFSEPGQGALFVMKLPLLAAS